MKKLKLEVNSKTITDSIELDGLKKRGILITPPIDSDYWTVRVNIFEDQYIQAFPKFMTMGIGFSIEDDWNTNLPYTCDSSDIYEHIKHNRRYIAATKKRCIRAIEMIQVYLE